MSAYITLSKKELRQNMIIFLFPFIFLMGVWFLKRQCLDWFGSAWMGILDIALPLALAVSYGLQSFDLEENKQTRDFLITKPMSVVEIIWSKYLCGLIVLLILTAFWHHAFITESYKITPTLSDYSSFWYISYFLLVVVAYTANFSTGVFIKGPVKFLLGALIGFLAIVWFFFCWYESLTAAFLSYSGIRQFGWIYLIIFILSCGLLVFIIWLFQTIAVCFLRNLNFFSQKKQVIILILGVLLFPVIIFLWNFANKPAVKPFNSLAMFFISKNDDNQLYVAVNGAKQPGHGDLYAFSDAKGRLALARLGEMPIPIFQGTGKKQLTELSWSPDGKRIAFCDNAMIRVIDIPSKKIVTLGQGEIPLWSYNSQHIIFLTDQEESASKTPVLLKKYRLYVAMAKAEQPVLPLGELKVSSTAFAWDARKNNLYYIENNVFYCINLVNKKATYLNISPGDKKPESIFYSRIISNDPDSRKSQFMVLTISDKEQLKRRVYNLYLYDFEYETQKVIKIVKIKNVNFEDVIPLKDGSILGGIGNGVYREIKGLREVGK